MKDTVYKLIELTGTSSVSMQDAVENAIATAHQSLRNLSWFQVVETRGSIGDGVVSTWQVTIKIGLAVETAAATAPG